MPAKKFSPRELSLLKRYQRTGRLFLDRLERNTRMRHEQLHELGEMVREIDRIKMVEYFARQGIKITPGDPKTIPDIRIRTATSFTAKRLSSAGFDQITPGKINAADQFTEVVSRVLMDKKLPAGKAVVVPKKSFKSFIIQISREQRAYLKSKKPPICGLLISSTDLTVSHELGQLLRVAEKIKKEEESGKYPPKVKPTLRQARNLVELLMLDALSGSSTFGLVDFFDFTLNMLKTAKLLQAQLAAH